MRIAVGCDHRGIKVKKLVTELLTRAGYSYQDFGAFSTDPVDYPDIAREVAHTVRDEDFDCGILICGTGIGMSIAANKVRGIRAANCHNAFSAYRARLHNDANILCLAAEEGSALIPAILEKFLTTEFEGGRHQKRLDKVSVMEKEES